VAHAADTTAPRAPGRRRLLRAALALPLAALGGCGGAGLEQTVMVGGESANFIPEVPYVRTPDDVVAAMVGLAAVGPGDFVVELGCGDGQILIAAAQRGASGLGVDIDPHPLHLARHQAAAAGVAQRVRFVRGDLFDTDLRRATVVMLYLSNDLNARLIPKLRRELVPGARVVSHKFHMGDWRPDAQRDVDGVPVYLWRIGARG
jgi:SAM-dependent methyltransferase